MTLPGPLELVVLALACWRIAALVTYERGPFHLFQRLRTRAGITADEDTGAPEAWEADNFVHGLLVCPWCLSVWVGAALTLAYLALPQVTVWLCVPLALSGGAIVVERWNHG